MTTDVGPEPRGGHAGPSIGTQASPVRRREVILTSARAFVVVLAGAAVALTSACSAGRTESGNHSRRPGRWRAGHGGRWIVRTVAPLGARRVLLGLRTDLMHVDQLEAEASDAGDEIV